MAKHPKATRRAAIRRLVDAWERTPRQQRRHERGAQRAQRRKESQKSYSLESDPESQIPSETREPPAGACGRSSANAISEVVASSEPADAEVKSAGSRPGCEPQQHEEERQPRQPKLMPRVLQLQQLPTAAGGKQGAPATPSKEPVADSSSPGSSMRPDPKRLAVPVECASGATLQKTDPTECRSGPHTNESDMESSDSDSELTAEDKFNITAVAAMSGDMNARAFILESYTKGHLPPDLASRANEVLRRTLDIDNARA